jgi:hypothetical protein
LLIFPQSKIQSPAALFLNPELDLFDHLVRPVQYRLRISQTNLLRYFQIDHELKLRQPLHEEFARLRSLEYFVHKEGGAAKYVRLAHPIGYKATDLHPFPAS